MHPVIPVFAGGILGAPDFRKGAFISSASRLPKFHVPDTPGTVLTELTDFAVEPGPAKSQGDGERNKTLMEIMIGQGFLGPDDPRRMAAARNLEAHIAEMTALCRDRGMPMIVCTLPAKERDLAPLGTDDISFLRKEDQGKLKAKLDRGLALVETDPARAAKAFRSVLKLHPNHARAHYGLGRAHFALGEYDAAREAFQAALDLDPMPWRAPGPSVEAIRRAARQRDATLCDLQAVFRDASPGGCTGWELMDDHVHPSLQGQALIARALVEALTTFDGPLAVDRAALASLPAWTAYAERMGDNKYTRYGVAHTMRVLCHIPFFLDTNPEAFERFDGIARSLEKTMDPAVVEVVRRWQAPTVHRVAKRPIAGMVAEKLIAQGRLKEAERLFGVAQRCVPTLSSWNIKYVYFALACRRQDAGTPTEQDRRVASAAIERGKILLKYGGGESGLTERHVGRLYQLNGKFAEAIPFLRAARQNLDGRDLVAADKALIDSYVKTGDLPAARHIIQQGIESSGEYAGIYRKFNATIPKD